MDKIFISFSGGRSSALTTRILVERYGRENCIILFANTGKENEATYKFVSDCAKNWDYEIIWIEATFEKYDGSKSQRDCIGFKVVNENTFRRNNVIVQDNSTPFGDMIEAFSMLPNRQARFCTQYLKIEPMEKYLKSINVENYQTAMGIRFDEKSRVMKHPEKLLPLNKFQITKEDVLLWWSKQPFDLDLKEHHGNCDLCVLKSPRKVKTIMRENPNVCNWYAEYEKKLDTTFFENKTIDDIYNLSKRKFALFRENEKKSQLKLFGQDLEISCFCGD
jgi:Phosphoadenosine phosphosulfate reductase family